MALFMFLNPIQQGSVKVMTWKYTGGIHTLSPAGLAS
jgi:hypothetical protein